jgi:plastocyanin
MPRIRVRPPFVAVAVLAAAALALAACGGGGYGSSGGSKPSPAASPPASSPATGGVRGTGSSETQINIVEGPGNPATAWNFDPKQVTVPAGATITFTNTGSETHTATADDGSFDTGALNPGESKTVTLSQPGTFSYHCDLHPFMTATITVSGGTSGAAPAPTQPATSGTGIASGTYSNY